MSTPADWIRGYVRQADADFRAWELYEKCPEAVASDCHKLLFLQMACEKLCKAYLIQKIRRRKHFRRAMLTWPGPCRLSSDIRFCSCGKALKGMMGLFTQIRHLASEIEVLNPAVRRDGQRPDNCEFPWEDANGNLHSPLDWDFHPSRLLTAPAGRTF